MWDENDGLPYGSINIDEIKNKEATIELSVKNAGRVKLYAAQGIQEQLVILYNGELTSGKQLIKGDLSALSEEFYYILLFYEGKLAHFQEIDLRKPVNALPSFDH